MRASVRSPLRGTTQQVTARFVLLQTALIAIVLLLGLFWLHVPDASTLEVIGSLLLGVTILAVAGGGETSLVLFLADRPRERRMQIVGSVLGVAGLLVWWAFSVWLGHLDEKSYLYASYANSRLPHGLRVVFTFARLSALLHWLWTTLEWVALGLVVVSVVCYLASPRPGRAALRVLRSVTWWVVLVLLTQVGVYGVAALLHWVPGHSLGLETTSLVVRLLTAVLVSGFFLSVLLCLVVVLIEDAGLLYPMSDGTPLRNQPRTVGRL